MFKTVVCIAAHSDDIEISSGGTVAKLVQEGSKVHFIVTSDSSGYNYNGEILRTKVKANQEQNNAATILGVQSVTNYSFKNKQVPFNYQIIELLNEQFDELKPDLIITQHIEESHQDHTNTVKSVLAAARYYPRIWMMEPTYPSQLSNQGFRPQVYVDITKQIGLKLEAVTAYTSQIKTHPYWLNMVKSMATLRGIEINCRFAETFEIIKDKYGN